MKIPYLNEMQNLKEWRARGRDAAIKFLQSLRAAERKSNPESSEYEENYGKGKGCKIDMVAFKKRCGVTGSSSCEPFYKKRAKILSDWDKAVVQVLSDWNNAAFQEVLAVNNTSSYKDCLKPTTPEDWTEAERVLKEHVARLPATAEEETAWWKGVEDARNENRDECLTARPATPPKTDDKKITKRARGKDGGRTPDDGQRKIDEAVQDVLRRLDNNKITLTQRKACNLAIKEYSLNIEWQGLMKQVRNSPKWEPLKKRIRIARK